MDRGNGHGAGTNSDEDKFENPDYWRNINNQMIKRWTKEKTSKKLHQQALFNAHGLLKTQQTEIQRLKKLLEKKDSVQVKEAITETSSADGKKDPLTLFPEEIWEMLLNFVEDAESLENSSLTCQLFANILEPRKVQWMFGKILPSIYHHLSKDDILNCRLACKNWMNAVDRHLDRNSGAASDPEDLSTYNSIQCAFKYSYSLSPRPFPLHTLESSNQMNGGRQNNITSVMRLLSRNPSLGRSVSVPLLSNSRSSFLQTFLFFYGRHIRYLKIQPYVSEVSGKRVQQILNQCLAKTPKLKTLHLDCALIHRQSTLLTINCRSLESLIIENYLQIDELMSALSQQLICLELNCWSATLSRFQWENLKELNLRLVTNEDTLPDLLKTTLPSLKSLKIAFRYFEKSQVFLSSCSRSQITLYHSLQCNSRDSTTL